MLHPAANRHPKATHQWLLLGVQACRLPALQPNKPNRCHTRRQKPPQGYTNGSRHPPGRSNGFLGVPAIPAAAAMASSRRSRLPFDRLQTPKMLRRPFAMVRRPVVPSPVAVSPCCSSRKASPRPQQWLLTQQWLLIGVRGCRLTGFKPLKCSAGRLPCSAGRSTTRPQQWLQASPRPQQWLLI